MNTDFFTVIRLTERDIMKSLNTTQNQKEEFWAEELNTDLAMSSVEQEWEAFNGLMEGPPVRHIEPCAHTQRPLRIDQRGEWDCIEREECLKNEGCPCDYEGEVVTRQEPRVTIRPWSREENDKISDHDSEWTCAVCGKIFDHMKRFKGEEWFCVDCFDLRAQEELGDEWEALKREWDQAVRREMHDQFTRQHGRLVA